MRVLAAVRNIGHSKSTSVLFPWLSSSPVFFGNILSRAGFTNKSKLCAVMTIPQDSDKPSKIRKRIIVACDGTWQDADRDSQRDYPWWKFWRKERHLMPPSNVARLCRCISKEGVDEKGQPAPQVVFYQAGVGTSWMQHLGGGLTGKGITSNIRDAYSFICNNYEEGDEIFLFGFSRGAFTVRSLSTLLRTIGILNASGLAHFYSISQDWKHQNEESWRLFKTPFIDEPWPSVGGPRPSPKTIVGKENLYVQKLKEYDFLRCDKAPISIKACGVWDTVGYVDSVFSKVMDAYTISDPLAYPRCGLFLKRVLRSTLLSTQTWSRTLNMPSKH